MSIYTNQKFHLVGETSDISQSILSPGRLLELPTNAVRVCVFIIVVLCLTLDLFKYVCDIVVYRFNAFFDDIINHKFRQLDIFCDAVYCVNICQF